MKKAVLVAFDAFTDVDVFLPWDILNRVKRFVPEFEVQIVGTAKVHRSAAGLDLTMHGGLSLCSGADLVFISSGSATRTLSRNPHFLQQLQLDSKRQLVCSICSGALILAGLGLLDGLSATTYPTAFDHLRAFGVQTVTDAHLVTHQNMATAAGCLAVLDLMEWAIEKLFGAEVACGVMNSLRPLSAPVRQV